MLLRNDLAGKGHIHARSADRFPRRSSCFAWLASADRDALRCNRIFHVLHLKEHIEHRLNGLPTLACTRLRRIFENLTVPPEHAAPTYALGLGIVQLDIVWPSRRRKIGRRER